MTSGPPQPYPRFQALPSHDPSRAEPVRRSTRQVEPGTAPDRWNVWNPWNLWNLPLPACAPSTRRSASEAARRPAGTAGTTGTLGVGGSHRPPARRSATLTLARVAERVAPRLAAAEPVTCEAHRDRPGKQREQGHGGHETQAHQERQAAKEAAEEQRKSGLRAEADADHAETNRHEQSEERDHDPVRNVLASVIERGDLFGRQDFVLLDDLGKMRDAVANAARVIAFPEAGREVVANNLPGKPVRQHALEAVAHLDAHFAIVGCDEHQHAVVGPGLTDAPVL